MMTFDPKDPALIQSIDDFIAEFTERNGYAPPVDAVIGRALGGDCYAELRAHICRRLGLPVFGGEKPSIGGQVEEIATALAEGRLIRYADERTGKILVVERAMATIVRDLPSAVRLLRDTADTLERANQTMRFDNAVAERHGKVAEIIRRHRAAIHAEISAFDKESLNIDDAGDKAELARQVLGELVDQLRGFGNGARMELAQEEAERRRMGFGED
jgi:hypothetical protein